MDGYLEGVIRGRYKDDGENRRERGGKTVLDLARKAYIEGDEDDEAEGKEKERKLEKSDREELGESFAKEVLGHMKLFILGGHDTTATAICYLYLMLFRHTIALSRLREEHTLVFGPQASSTGDIISANPALLNKLPYTLAVIKETLRLYPPVSSPRAGRPDFVFTDTEGRTYPTEHCLVWICHHGVHTDPALWPQATEFLPERWLVPEGHELHPIPGAWRPFEWGPRACIGQELALTELKIVLAMTVREFDVSDAYMDWDKQSGGRKEVKQVHGERAYQIQLGSGRASDGFPARVKFCNQDMT
ncbi:MAG: hypothetical protein Q9190_002460 [Brigantiaea leucoxantha]